MSSRPLLVGIAPPLDGLLAAFVDTRSGDRVARLLGLPDSSLLLERLDTANLSCRPVAEWQRVRRCEWARLAGELDVAGRVVVAAGVTVAEAIAGVPVQQDEVLLLPASGTLLAVMPHPSGLCRAWNDPQTSERWKRRLAAACALAAAERPWQLADCTALERAG